MSVNPKSIGVTEPYGNSVTTFEAHDHWGMRGYVLLPQLCSDVLILIIFLWQVENSS